MPKKAAKPPTSPGTVSETAKGDLPLPAGTQAPEASSTANRWLIRAGIAGLVIYLIIVGVLEWYGVFHVETKFLTPDDLAVVLANRTLLHVGGPHRSGTTLLHRLLSLHPEISRLASRKPKSKAVPGRGTEGPKDEGMFQQRVYPRFGIGTPSVIRTWNMVWRWVDGEGWRTPEPGGIGAWAFLPEAHLTEANETGLLTNAARMQLFSSWGRSWPLRNRSSTVFMEKSPVNIMLTRWLTALWRLPPVGDVVRVRFAITVRHPLAAAEAQRSWRDAEHLSRRQLVDHWLYQLETLATDAATLGGDVAVQVIKYEELVAQPGRTLEGLFRWLGVGFPEVSASTIVDRMPPRRRENDKYRDKFCSWLLNSTASKEEFDQMVRDFEERVLAVDSRYSLVRWGQRCNNGTDTTDTKEETYTE